MKTTLIITFFLFFSACNSNKNESAGNEETFTPILYSNDKTASAELGPFVGAVTPNSAVFVVKTSAEAEVIIECSELKDFSKPLYSNEVKAVKGNYNYAKPDIKKLKPDTRYFYRAVINKFPDSKVHEFKTAPQNTKSFVMGFGSCQQGYSQSNPALFPVIKNDSLSFFIHLGDWSYPDRNISREFYKDLSTIEQSYRMKYDYKYPFVSNVLSEMPIMYVYDDHDYAGNDRGGIDDNKLNSVKGYNMFFPHYPLPNSSNGIWQSFKYSDAEFFMLDLRSQRNDNKGELSDNGVFNKETDASILAGFPIEGENQKQWLERSLTASTAKWKVIVSSVIFNPRYLEALTDPTLPAEANRIKRGIIDKWAGYPKDIEFLLNIIKNNSIKNVILISGDSHSSYIDDGTNSVIPEISSSNLDVDNSNIGLLIMLAGYNVWNKGSYLENGRAYGRLTFNFNGTSSVYAEIINEQGQSLFNHTIEEQ